MDYLSLARNVLSTVGAFNWLNSMQTKYLPFKLGYILLEFFSSGEHKRGGHAQNSYRLQSQIYETKALLQLLAALAAMAMCYWMCCRGMHRKGNRSAQTVFTIIVFTHVLTIFADGALFYSSYRSEVDADVQEMAHWVLLVAATSSYASVILRNRNISVQQFISEFKHSTELTLSDLVKDQQRFQEYIQEVQETQARELARAQAQADAMAATPSANNIQKRSKKRVL
jgi:hypothetical protein